MIGAPLEEQPNIVSSFSEQQPLGYMNNAELNAIEDEKRKQTEDAQNDPVTLGLAAYVRTCWEAAKQARAAEVDERLFKCLRQRSGVHDPDIAVAIAEKGGSSIYMMLTDEKCTAAESWLEDILLPPDDKPWSVSPTPVPELAMEVERSIKNQIAVQKQLFYQRHGVLPRPEDVEQLMTQLIEEVHSRISQQAREEAERVETEIEDILAEADWKNALKQFLYYFVTYPVAYVKGPVLRQKPQLKWVHQGAPAVEDKVVKEFDVPSPFDIYPSPNSRAIDDGFLIERHVLTRSDLYALIGTDTGYSDDAIREVLKNHTAGGLRSWVWDGDTTRDTLEGRHLTETDPEGRIDALQFWGCVSGEKLKQWSGADSDEFSELDTEREYEAEVWLIDNTVIKAMLNPDPLGRKPYYKASFRELYGQYYGLGLPEIIRDSQLVCNTVAINLTDNIAISSGPQVGVDAAAMPEGEDFTHLFPWKVWPFDLQNTARQNGQPLWFFQPTSNAKDLLAVYDRFSSEADNKSGIPRYSYGNKETGGPLGTATGFSMMMNNAARGIKKVVRNVDYGVIAPSIMRLHDWLMLYDEKFQKSHRGDIKILARGSGALVAKEQMQIRLVETLKTTLSSPVLIQLIGMPGIAEIFRKVLQGVDVGVDGVIPGEAEIKIIDDQMKQQAQIQVQAQQKAQMQKQLQARATNPAGDLAGGQDVRTF